MVDYVFIGGTERGLKLLESLIKNKYKPKFAAILKEDEHEPKKYSAQLKEICDLNNIFCKIVRKLDSEFERLISENSCDLAVVCGWRTLINTDLNQYFKYGMIAAHDSLLPQYRGFAPINWAIINGESKTGVTLFRIGEGEVDSGDMFGQEIVDIDIQDFAYDIYKKIIEKTINLYLVLFLKIKNKQLVSPVKQIEENATYTCKRTPEDALINFNRTSIEVYNFIRAQAYPYPGAFFYHENKKIIINKVKIGSNNGKTFIGKIPGAVIKIDNESVEVLCESGSIEIIECSLDNTTDGLKVIKPNSIIKSINSRLTM
jgi:methionyl-tRNA formyltransferase